MTTTETGHKADCICGYCDARRKEEPTSKPDAVTNADRELLAELEAPVEPFSLDAMFRVMDQAPGAAALIATAFQIEEAAFVGPETQLVTVAVDPRFAKTLRLAARAMYRQAMERQ